MEFHEVMDYLKSCGNENTKKIFKNHGAAEPLFGVKVGDLKKIIKKIKGNNALALKLYASGISDAMYLAGLIADAKTITKEQLDGWVSKAYWYMLSEYAVGPLAAETPFMPGIAEEWILSANEMICAAGWSALSVYLSFTEDSRIDKNKIKDYLVKVEEEIHSAPNRVGYTMNNFVISVGAYIPDLLEGARKAAQRIGKVKVDMGGTSCKVPFAPDYIEKIVSKGLCGKKRKPSRC